MNHGLHVTSKRLASGLLRWYVYPWRGAGVAIYTCDGAKPTISKKMLDDAAEARKEARAAPENTLARLIADYKASPQFTGREESTLRDYRRSLDRIAERFGDAPLDVFEDRQMRGDILNWRDEWQGQPRTADKLTVMFGTLLEWGVERGKLSVNVAAGIKTLHDANRSEIVWEPHHWDAIAPHASGTLMDALELARMTGFRLGDLVKVSREHDHGQLIRFITAKRKRVVVVPVFPELRSLLDRLAAKYGNQGPILRNSYGKPWTASGLGGVYQKAKNKAGIDVHIHDLRGTYATWLCVKGLTDDEIARALGWSPKIVSDLRIRYVDEARVVTSIVERLSA